MNPMIPHRMPADKRYDRQAPPVRSQPVEAPRFVPKLVCRPSRGLDMLKIGIFAGLHGDEEAGTLAAYELMRWAWNDPIEIQDYELHIYPVCNPSGRSLGSRHSVSGADLNREFWNGSREPEVQYLEGELLRERYDGIVSLHSDNESHGIYGFVSGAVLSENVLAPALRAASAHLPINVGPVIDGFPGEDGIIRDGYTGVLCAPPQQRPRPLEIVFETPACAPMKPQVDATVIAVKAILAEYRRLQAYSPNL